MLFEEWLIAEPALGQPEEEPSAGKPHARICEGASRMAELLDHHPFAPW